MSGMRYDHHLPAWLCVVCVWLCCGPGGRFHRRARVGQRDVDCRGVASIGEPQSTQRTQRIVLN
jgi:hypothetical protein